MEKVSYEKLLNMWVYIIYKDYLTSVFEKAVEDIKRKEMKK